MAETLHWSDETIFQMPYLRVAMHLRNLEIISLIDKDRQDSEDAKHKLKAKQETRLKDAGVR